MLVLSLNPEAANKHQRPTSPDACPALCPPKVISYVLQKEKELTAQALQIFLVMKTWNVNLNWMRSTSWKVVCWHEAGKNSGKTKQWVQAPTVSHSDPQREHKGQTQHLCYRQDGFWFINGKTKNFIVLCTTQKLQQPESVDYKNELHLSYHSLSTQD